LLIGTGWKGVLNFSDKETMDHFNAYNGKPKPKAEPELFYWDDGLSADDALHQHILDGGDHAKAEAVSRKVAKRLGLTDQEYDRLLGKKPAAK
jgi:hypothetical protein